MATHVKTVPVHFPIRCTWRHLIPFISIASPDARNLHQRYPRVRKHHPTSPTPISIAPAIHPAITPTQPNPSHLTSPRNPKKSSDPPEARSSRVEIEALTGGRALDPSYQNRTNPKRDNSADASASYWPPPFISCENDGDFQDLRRQGCSASEARSNPSNASDFLSFLAPLWVFAPWVFGSGWARLRS